MSDSRPHWLTPTTACAVFGYAVMAWLALALVAIAQGGSDRHHETCRWRYEHAAANKDSLSVIRECGTTGRAKP